MDPSNYKHCKLIFGNNFWLSLWQKNYDTNQLWLRWNTRSTIQKFWNSPFYVKSGIAYRNLWLWDVYVSVPIENLNVRIMKYHKWHTNWAFLSISNEQYFYKISIMLLVASCISSNSPISIFLWRIITVYKHKSTSHNLKYTYLYFWRHLWC